MIQKGSNIKIKHPVHLLPLDPDIQRVQRIVLAPPWSESIRESQKVLFPDLVENRPYRVLDDFILQRRDSQWSLPSIAFRDIDSS